MKKISITDIAGKLQNVVKRFTFPVFFVLGLSFLLFLNINKHDADIQERLWVFFGLGIPMSLTVALFAENFKNLLVRIGLQLGAIILLALHVLFLPEDILNFQMYQVLALGLVAVLAAFVVSYFKKDDAVPFWEFSKTTILQLIISVIFSQVLMLGLSLAVLSLDQLFKIKIEGEVYENLAVICYAIFIPFYFFANIPEGDDKYKQEYKYDKFLKILGLYILLPILAIYTVILYVYSLQIVARWELPNGWVTWLISVLALVGFFAMMITYPLRLQANKVAVFFARYFPVILFPLLILMTVGIFRRFDDYGLTINRAYVFLLNFWLYGACIYLFVSQSKYLKWLVFSFIAVTLVSSVGPWSVYDVTQRNMMKETTQLLAENHYLKDGKFIPDAGIKKLQTPDSIKKILSSKLGYLLENYGTVAVQPLFKEDIKGKNRHELMESKGFKSNFYYVNDSKYYNVHSENDNPSIDIQQYSSLIRLKLFQNQYQLKDSLYTVKLKDETLMVTKSDDSKYKTVISLTAKLNELTKTTNYQEWPQHKLTVTGQNYQIIIMSMNATKENANDRPTVTNLEAILLLK